MFEIVKEVEGSVVEIVTSAEGEMLRGEFRVIACNLVYANQYSYVGRAERTKMLGEALRDFAANVLEV